MTKQYSPPEQDLLKKHIRESIKKEKEMRLEEEMRKKSDDAIKALLDNPHIKESHSIAMYYSLPDEVNTHKAIKQMLKSGKRVFLPVVKDNVDMVFCEYTGKENLIKGRFNILEPCGEKDNTKAIEFDTIVVPGIAFDKQGNRLGRGKGFYDRALANVKCYKIGLCFDFQIIDNVPTNEHDIRMDEIISG